MLVEISIKQEAVDLIKSTAFFRFDENSKQVKKAQKNYWIRVLWLMNLITESYIISKRENKSNHISLLSTLSQAISNKTNIRQALSVLSDMNFIIIEEIENNANVYHVNEEIIEQNTVNLSYKEMQLWNNLSNKSKKRAAKALPSKQNIVSINISKAELQTLLFGKSGKSIEKQWKTICKINSNGFIEGKQKNRRRLYSDISNISKAIHPYILIDGCETNSYDQHATFLSFLPVALEKIRLSSISEDLHNDILRLKTLIKNNDDLYEEISKQLSNTSREDIKDGVVKYISSKKPFLSSNAKKVQSYFKAYFEHFDMFVNRFRESGFIRKELVKLETGLFVYVARRLNKQGIPSFTKHDSIFFKQSDLDTVKRMIDDRCIVLGVNNKLKIDRLSVTPFGRDKELIVCTFKEIDSPFFTTLEKEREEEQHMVSKNGLLDDLKGTKAGEKESLKVQNTDLKGTKELERSDLAEPISKKTRNRKANISQMPDGRYTTKLKGTKYNSRKGETLEEFKERIGVTDMPIDKNFLEKVEESFKQPVEAFPSGVETVVDGKSDKESPRKSESLKSSIEWNEKYEFSSIFDSLNEDEDEQ